MQSGALFVCGVSQSGSTTVSLFLMRTLLAPDDMVAELIAKRHANGWDIYDYEIGNGYGSSSVARRSVSRSMRWRNSSAFAERADRTAAPIP